MAYDQVRDISFGIGQGSQDIQIAVERRSAKGRGLITSSWASTSSATARSTVPAPANIYSRSETSRSCQIVPRPAVSIEHLRRRGGQRGRYRSKRISEIFQIARNPLSTQLPVRQSPAPRSPRRQNDRTQKQPDRFRCRPACHSPSAPHDSASPTRCRPSWRPARGGAGGQPHSSPQCKVSAPFGTAAIRSF